MYYNIWVCVMLRRPAADQNLFKVTDMVAHIRALLASNGAAS